MKVRHIDFYADEFLGGVTNFSAQDIGVYWVACSIMYADGGPIPENHPRFRVIKIRQTDLAASLDRLVAAGKLLRTSSGLVQKRVQEELERSSSRIRKSHENGAKGGRPSKKSNGLAKPAGYPLGYSAKNLEENPNTNYQLPTTNQSRATRFSPDFPFDPEWRKWAVEFGFPENRVDQEYEGFRDYWCGVAGKAGLKIDWFGTWRNRIRNATDRLPNGTRTKTKKTVPIIIKPPSDFGKEVDDLLAGHDWS